MAYEKQGLSLQAVQKFGPQLEAGVRKFLNWPKGRVVYYLDKLNSLKYDIEMDSCYPNISSPEVFVSVTYANPDNPGHSNENKLHLKVGELILLKAAYPDIRSILVIGGNQGTWSPYILKAFQYFFDETIFMWEEDAEERLEAIRENPSVVTPKHRDVWETLRKGWESTTLWTDNPIHSRLRSGLWGLARNVGREGELPSDISNELMRHCMQTAYNVSLKNRGRAKAGIEWSHYYNQDWSKLWQSRSYFNPAEAAIDLTLRRAGLAYSGGLAVDVPVPSLLHFLGGTEVDRTKVSEDFVLFSRKYNQPVFIQSKSTGGGLKEHGKNIQNRTKEQLTRGLIYRGSINSEGNIEVRPQDFIWIGVLENNWGVTKRTPLKYMHMLQWAGYQYLLAADSLVNDRFELLLVQDNPLVRLLNELDCYSSQSDFEHIWASWLKERTKKIEQEPQQLQPQAVESILNAEQQHFSFWEPVSSEDEEE